MKNKTTDEKIVLMVEWALKNRATVMLFKLADILNKRAHSEIVYAELMKSFDEADKNK